MTVHPVVESCHCFNPNSSSRYKIINASSIGESCVCQPAQMNINWFHVGSVKYLPDGFLRMTNFKRNLCSTPWNNLSHPLILKICTPVQTLKLIIYMSPTANRHSTQTRFCQKTLQAASAMLGSFFGNLCSNVRKDLLLSELHVRTSLN